MLVSCILPISSGTIIVTTDATSPSGAVASAATKMAGILLLTTLKSCGQNDFVCDDGNFLYVANNTCLPCPQLCSSCWYDVTNVGYPCQACTENSYFEFPGLEVPVVDDLGHYDATCSTCSDENSFASDGTRLIYLEQTSIYSVDGYYEGRLWVNVSGIWGLVCDDGWSMSNSVVACSELSLGTAIAYFSSFDNTPENASVLMDNVHCSGDETSIFQCSYLGEHDDNCVQGEAIRIRCSGPDMSRRCVNSCSVGDYGNVLSRRCEPCSNDCLDCTGSPNYCIQCPRHLVLDDGQCILYCSDGFYRNTRSNTCERCSDTCLTCIDGISNDICASCKESLVLHESGCSDSCPDHTYYLYSDTIACVDSCPRDYTRVGATCVLCSGSCHECSDSPTNCTSCGTDLVLQHHLVGSALVGTCQPSCDTFHYANMRGACTPCSDGNCQRCYIGGQYCESCKEGYLLELHRCTLECSAGLHPREGICMPYCPPGYYSGLDSPQCLPCPANCLECINGSICTSCSPNHYLQSGTCVNDCGSDYVAFSNPTVDDVRLVGGMQAIEGRVEIFYEGIWGYICGIGWTLAAARLVCEQLRLGTALRVTSDATFGLGSFEIGSVGDCSDTQQTLRDCLAVSSGTTPACSSMPAGVYCSGPDTSEIRECRLMTSQSCEQAPCYPGVTCLSFPEGHPYAGMSYCGQCPRNFWGDGVHCKAFEVPAPAVVFPPSLEMALLDWPEAVQLTLFCVTAMPNAYSLSWYIDEREILNNEDHRVEADGTLTIFRPVGQPFSGTYSCVADYEGLELSAYYTISVQQQVEITEPPVSQNASGRVVLSCGYIGYPSPGLTWLKDGETIELGANITMNSSGSLIITSSFWMFSGSYTCVVSNNISMDTATADVLIQAVPYIVNRPLLLTATAGQPFSYVCAASGGPEPILSWKKDREDIINTESLYTTADGGLHIANVTRADGGAYACIATNDEGLDVWTVNLTVIEVPVVVIRPTTLVVPITEAAVFTCEVFGVPTPEVWWAVASRGIFSTSDAAEDATSSQLMLSDVSEEDDGHILCIAANPAGQTNASALLTVTVPPHFINAPTDLYLLEAWSVFIEWSVYGVPMPTIILLRDSIVLQGINISLSGFYLTPVYPNDTGLYTMNASNSNSGVQASATITVVPQYSLPRLVSSTKTNITLALEGIPSPEPSALYEVWTIDLITFEPDAQLRTSPINIHATELDGVRLAMLYDELPATITLGDGRNYTSTMTDFVAVNYPLLPQRRYAVCVRLVKPGDPPDVTVPVGSTAYTYVITQTYPLASSRSDSLDGWEVALIVLFVLLLLVLLSALIYNLWRDRDKLSKKLASWARMLRIWSSQDSSSSQGPLDVEHVLAQFSPNPSPTHAQRGDHSATTSSSTIYIPTEDEIDKLEKLGNTNMRDTAPMGDVASVAAMLDPVLIPNIHFPGINYYEDDHWIVNVPYGVLDMPHGRLEYIKQHAINQIYLANPLLRRSSSEPNVYSNGLEISETFYRRFSDTSDLDTSRKRTGRNQYGEPIYDPGRNIEFGWGDIGDNVHGVVIQTQSSLSRDSKQSDSGFESEQVHKQRSFTLKNELNSLKRHHIPVVDDDDELADDEQVTNDGLPTAFKRRHMRRMDRRRKSNSRKLGRWRHKGAALLSKGRKWARSVLDRNRASDDDSLASSRSGDSDIELSHVSKRLPTVASQQKLHLEVEAEMDSSYIDPKALASIPKPSHRMDELLLHNQDMDRPSGSDPGTSQVTHAFVHQSNSNEKKSPKTSHLSAQETESMPNSPVFGGETRALLPPSPNTKLPSSQLYYPHTAVDSSEETQSMGRTNPAFEDNEECLFVVDEQDNAMYNDKRDSVTSGPIAEAELSAITSRIRLFENNDNDTESLRDNVSTPNSRQSSVRKLHPSLLDRMNAQLDIKDNSRTGDGSGMSDNADDRTFRPDPTRVESSSGNGNETDVGGSHASSNGYLTIMDASLTCRACTANRAAASGIALVEMQSATLEHTCSIRQDNAGPPLPPRPEGIVFHTSDSFRQRKEQSHQGTPERKPAANTDVPESDSNYESIANLERASLHGYSKLNDSGSNPQLDRLAGPVLPSSSHPSTFSNTGFTMRPMDLSIMHSSKDYSFLPPPSRTIGSAFAIRQTDPEVIAAYKSPKPSRLSIPAIFKESE